MKSSVYLFSIGVVLAVFRIFIEDNSGLDLVLVMGVINMVAFNYVVLLIQGNILKSIEDKLSKSSLQSEQQNNCLKKANCIVRIFCWIIFIGGSLLYVIKFRCAALNDVLSIMALVISISEFFGEQLYKML